MMMDDRISPALGRYLTSAHNREDYSVLSFAFIDRPPGFVPLGLSAWKEKSISPTRVLTCLIRVNVSKTIP
jgi:hypothetical protein